MLLLLRRTNFATQMKRIALILLVIFSLVQAGPAISSLISPSTIIFMVDEEKNEDKHKEDNKKESKKVLLRQSILSASVNPQITLSDLSKERILPPPFLEKVSPPPNF